MGKATKKTALGTLCIGALILFGCQETPTQPREQGAVPDTHSQRLVSEVKVGEGSVAFYADNENLSFLEKRKPGAAPIIGKDMEGLTLAEIHRILAPGQKVPEELSDSHVIYAGVQSRPADGGAPEGAHLDQGAAVPLAKAADINDTWFRDNYCSIYNNWSGYKACLLNQGETTAWAWSNATQSEVQVYPHTGTYVHLNGKINGSSMFDADLPAGYVYRYYMFSGRDWWKFGLGCRSIRQHYYTITHTAGQRWHWALGSLNGC